MKNKVINGTYNVHNVRHEFFMVEQWLTYKIFRNFSSIIGKAFWPAVNAHPWKVTAKSVEVL